MTAPHEQPKQPKPMTVRELLRELREVPEKDRDCVVMKTFVTSTGKVLHEPVFELTVKVPRLCSFLSSEVKRSRSGRRRKRCNHSKRQEVFMLY